MRNELRKWRNPFWSLRRIEILIRLVYEKVKHMDLTATQIEAIDQKVLDNTVAAATAFAAMKQNILNLQQQIAGMSGISPEASAALAKLLTDAGAAHDEIVADSGIPGDPNAVSGNTVAGTTTDTTVDQTAGNVAAE